jgi:tetratricopeptide (TPR) repeat protein
LTPSPNGDDVSKSRGDPFQGLQMLSFGKVGFSRFWVGSAFVVWIALVSPVRADGPSWTNGSAAELVRQGQERVKNGDEAVAARRFVEALQLDPSYGPAYLELAAARERAGDLTEAERTYDVAIRNVPDFAAGFRARAALLHRLGDFDREMSDLETAVRLTDKPDLMRDLAQRYVEDGAWPAALATWRKILVANEKRADDRLAREATLQIRALVVLCGELDPVVGGASSRDWVRRSEATVAKRRGM